MRRLDLHQIAQSAAADGQVPGWDDSTGLWVPTDVVLGLTSADTSVAITDNGDGTLDLAASGATETLPASIIDAKGDLIVGTADNTAIRKAVGTDGQVLTADAASTGGVKWATASGGGGAATFHGARAIRSTNQSTGSGVNAVVTFPDSEDYDTDGLHSLVTNSSRMTIPTGLGGYWSFKATVRWDVGSNQRLVVFAVDGTTLAQGIGGGQRTSGWSGQTAVMTTAIDLHLNAGQYVEVIATQNAGTINITDASFSAFYLGA